MGCVGYKISLTLWAPQASTLATKFLPPECQWQLSRGEQNWTIVLLLVQIAYNGPRNFQLLMSTKKPHNLWQYKNHCALWFPVILYLVEAFDTIHSKDRSDIPGNFEKKNVVISA